LNYTRMPETHFLKQGL